MKLSVHEKRLQDFAREEFGTSLAQFLLASLGEKETPKSCLFTIVFTIDGTIIRREVEITAGELLDSKAQVTQGRDPLIMLALLRLLILREQISASLSYDVGDVLELLGWKDTTSSRRAVDEAVECYSSLIYRWSMGSDELALKGLAFYNSRECCVSGFSRLDKEEDSGRPARVINRIDFNKEFVESLRQRSLFEVDWNSVQSIIRTLVP